MKVKTLSLTNFRNYQHAEIAFNENSNIFIGNNAQGKTSLLESIYFLALAKSYRTFRDKELIKFAENFARVSCSVEKNQTVATLDVIISLLGKKVLINDNEKRKISEYIGFLKVVIFSPEDLKIIKGDPLHRRRFIDMEISQISAKYIYMMNQYNKILKQRNEYLKANFMKIDFIYLDTLSEKLAETGCYITKAREGFINKLNYYACNLHRHISDFKENLEIKYVSNYNTYVSDVTTKDIYSLYRNNYHIDQKYGNTQIGIQKDDMRFFINKVDAGNYGSQGQQRTIVLAIKLALIDIIKTETSYFPVVLLDDVLSELDDNRQTQLFDYIISDVQTFITSTNLAGIRSDLVRKADVFHINNAIISQRKSDFYDG